MSLKFTFLILFLICSKICIINGESAFTQEFIIQAYATKNYVIPMFSSSSNLTDFQETLNFFLALPNLPDNFAIFGTKNGTHRFISCKSKSHFCEYDLNSNLSSPNFQEVLYSSSLISTNPLEMSQIAITLLLEDSPLCDYSINTCFINRINFVILSDYSNFDKIYQTNTQIFSQIYYFVISSSANSEATKIPYPDQKQEIKYFYSNQDIPDQEISDQLFDDIILYTLNAYANFYNIFLVVNETYLNATIGIAETLLSALPVNFGWGVLSPRLYSIAVKRNETSYYQTSTLYLNGMYQYHFYETVTTHFNTTSTTVLQTSLLEENLKKIFLSDIDGFYDSQWNILISDQFPHWIKKTSLFFNSFQKHFDVYLFNSKNYSNELKNEMGQYLNDIIVDDENSTIRENHLLLIDINFNSTKQMPTFKTSMDSTIFNYTIKKQTRWFWYAVGVFAFISFIAGILFYFWRRKMKQKLEEKYSWATKSGISIQEADVLIEKGKDIFIEGDFITVDFNKIIGKGSSAIVYEGFLATVSPITSMYPRLETRNYSNCKTAIKIGNTFSKDEFEQIFREVEASIRIGWHRHVCCLLGWSVFQSMPVLLFELIDGTDLLLWAQSFQCPENSEEVMSEKTVTQILWQISDGMEHIASLGILHKDLAARNILLSQRLEAKITDFGLASSCNESFTYEAPIQRRLPLRWMAPEALKNRLFSEFSDVWAFAVLAWEVFSKGEIPYGNIDGNDILEFITAGNRLKIPEEVSGEWKKLLNDCWNERKEERPRFKEIKMQIGAFLETQTINYGYLSCELNEL